MENKLVKAKILFEQSTTPVEKEICKLTVDFIKNIYLDDECILSCYLYYPYIKTAIYVPPTEAELKTFDDAQRKQEDERKQPLPDA